MRDETIDPTDPDSDSELSYLPRYAPFTFSRLEEPWKHFHVPLDAPYEIDETLLPALCRVDKALRKRYPTSSKASLRREIGSALSALVSDDLIEGIGMKIKEDPMMNVYREIGTPQYSSCIKRIRFGAVSVFLRTQLWGVIDKAMIGADETDYVIAEGVVVLLEEVVNRSGRPLHEVYLEAVAWIKRLAREWSTFPFSPARGSDTSLIHRLMDRDASTVTWTLFALESPPEAFSRARADLVSPQRTAAVYETLRRQYGISTDPLATYDLAILGNPYEGLSEENVITHKILYGEDKRSRYPGWDRVRGWVSESSDDEE